MNRLPACRVCLAYNTRLCSIMDGQLRDVYETLVEASLDTEDMLPTAVCYNCFSLMKKMLQFRDRSQKANQILQHMISAGLQLSVNSLAVLVKDQSGMYWTLGISDIERTTTGKAEITVKIESVKSEMDIDGMSDHNEDYSDAVPEYKDSTNSEDDLSIQNMSKRCKTDRVEVKETPKVHLEKRSGYEGAAPPEKRKSDKIESENESVNIQAPLRKAEKDEPKEKKRDKKKVSDLNNRSKKYKSSLKTILKETETTTSNISSKKHNESAFIKNDSVTPPIFIFTCDVCKNEYQSKKKLKRHIQKSHVIELNRNANSINSGLKVKHECKSTNVLEGQELQNNDNLSETNKCRKNIKKRSKGKQYQCSYCMKRFTSNRSLSSHLRIHTKQNLYKCDIICEKGISQRRQVTDHLRVHTKEKPFKCDVCEKGFFRSSHLTVHLKIHSGEKPYSCSYCDKRFSLNGNLTQHLRVHTKEKPFKCDICEKGFSQSSHLTTHLRIHSGEKPYSCSYCNKRFTSRQNLNSHILTIHAKENH